MDSLDVRGGLTWMVWRIVVGRLVDSLGNSVWSVSQCVVIGLKMVGCCVVNGLRGKWWVGMWMAWGISVGQHVNGLGK